MSAIVLNGIRPSKPGDHALFTGNCFPSLSFLSSRKLAQVIQESVHQRSKLKEPWKTDQWQTARNYLCQNLLPFLLTELHKKFLSSRYIYKSFGCGRCKVSVKKSTDFHQIHLSAIQEMLIDWLCDPIWNPAYVRHRRFDLSEHSALLNLDNLYVTETSIFYRGQKLLSEFLPKMVHLKVIYMLQYNAEAEVFDVLAKNCHLRKLVIHLPPEYAKDSFIKFLLSQSHSLQAIEFENTFCISEVDPQLAKIIWNVLAELRHLTSLKWFSSSLISVSRERKIKPLQKLQTLELEIQEEHQVIDKIPVDRMFPVLEKYDLTYCFHGEIEPLPPVLENDNPGENEPLPPVPECIKVLRNLSKVTSIWIMYSDSEDDFEEDEFKSIPTTIPANFLESFPNLRRMDCIGLRNLSFDQLKAIFGSMPKLMHCHLHAEMISDFDEKSFISFLKCTVKNREKLVKLHLDIYEVEMTGATACAILRYSNIETFENLSWFRFTSNELEELESLARKKRLTIVQQKKW